MDNENYFNLFYESWPELIDWQIFMIMTWLQNGIIVNHWALCIHIDQNYDEVAEQQDFIAFWDSTKEYGDTAEAQTAAL